jgi:hypothetical protein
LYFLQLQRIACKVHLLFGLTRHLLSAHIGNTKDDSSHTSETPAGAGEILRQCLEGGVFCWLQRVDGAHLSRTVQVILTYKHIAFRSHQHERNLPVPVRLLILHRTRCTSCWRQSRFNSNSNTAAHSTVSYPAEPRSGLSPSPA